MFTITQTHTHTQQYFKCPFWVENSIGNTRVGKLIIAFLSIVINVCRYANFTWFYFVQSFLKFTSLPFAFDLLYFTASTIRLSWKCVRESDICDARAANKNCMERANERESMQISCDFWSFLVVVLASRIYRKEKERESASARPTEQLFGSVASYCKIQLDLICLFEIWKFYI